MEKFSRDIVHVLVACGADQRGEAVRLFAVFIQFYCPDLDDLEGQRGILRLLRGVALVPFQIEDDVIAVRHILIIHGNGYIGKMPRMSGSSKYTKSRGLNTNCGGAGGRIC